MGHIRFRHTEVGGGVQSVFTPLKGDMRSFTLSRGRMQKSLFPNFLICSPPSP